MISHCLCCFCCGLLPGVVFSCLPYDRRRVYRVGEQFYEASGDPIGYRVVNFKPEEEEELNDPIDRDMCMIACLISGVLALALTVLLVALHATSLPPEKILRW